MTAKDLDELAAMRDRLASGEAKILRQGMRLSSSEVARNVGVSRAAIWLWENGRRWPQGAAALRYARLLAGWHEHLAGGTVVSFEPKSGL